MAKVLTLVDDANDDFAGVALVVAAGALMIQTPGYC
jgi:hypothetical protein